MGMTIGCVRKGLLIVKVTKRMQLPVNEIVALRFGKYSCYKIVDLSTQLFSIYLFFACGGKGFIYSSHCQVY